MIGSRCSASPAMADATARATQRLRQPARGAGGEDRPAPHQRVGVGHRDGEHLGRVDGEVAVGRAAVATSSSDSATASASACGPRCDVGEVVEHHDGGGQLVAGHRRAAPSRAGRPRAHRPATARGRRRRPGSRGVRPRRRRTRDPWSLPSGASITTRSSDAGPAGQAGVRARPRTAPGTTARAPPAAGGSRPGGDHRARPVVVAAAGDQLGGRGGRPWASRRTRAPHSASVRSRRSTDLQHLASSSRASSNHPPSASVLRPACGPRRPAAPGCRRGPDRRCRTRCRPARLHRPRRRPERTVAGRAGEDAQQLVVDVHALGVPVSGPSSGAPAGARAAATSRLGRPSSAAATGAGAGRAASRTASASASRSSLAGPGRRGSGASRSTSQPRGADSRSLCGSQRS